MGRPKTKPIDTDAPTIKRTMAISITDYGKLCELSFKLKLKRSKVIKKALDMLWEAECGN